MAINTLRTLAQLKDEATKLGLDVKPTKNTSSGEKTYSKDDFIYALRDYYLKQMGPAATETLKMMLHIDSPMLCQQFKVLKPEEQKEALDVDNNKWYAETKEDGNRMIVMYINGHFDAFSRNISVENFLPVSYGDHILLEGVDLTKVKHDFIIDCEVISSNPNICTKLTKSGIPLETATQLQATSAILALNKEQSLEIQRQDPLIFRTFDILYLDGEWLLDKPLIERLRLHRPLLEELKTTGLHVDKPRATRKNKRQFFEDIIAAGGEGIVLKSLTSTYNTRGNRQRDGWVKVKRSMSLMAKRNGLDDSIDCFVTGYELATNGKGWDGLVGSLEFTTYLKKKDGSLVPHVIAHVANIPLEMRKRMTVEGPDGKPCLDKVWYGKVASCDGATISARALCLQHPRLICWRPDRSPETCVLEEEFLLSQIGTVDTGNRE